MWLQRSHQGNGAWRRGDAKRGTPTRRTEGSIVGVRSDRTPQAARFTRLVARRRRRRIIDTATHGGCDAMPLPKGIRKVSDAIWEIPATHKPGMRVPARVYLALGM